VCGAAELLLSVNVYVAHAPTGASLSSRVMATVKVGALTLSSPLACPLIDPDVAATEKFHRPLPEPIAPIGVCTNNA